MAGRGDLVEGRVRTRVRKNDRRGLERRGGAAGEESPRRAPDPGRLGRGAQHTQRRSSYKTRPSLLPRMGEREPP